jgi:uncharacterized protein (DUF305 family)
MASFYKVCALAVCSAVLAIVCSVPAGAAADSQPMHQHGGMASAPPAPFVATSAKPFSGLMDDAMNVMSDGMGRAPMNGNPDHDFAVMMIPHHQGAIDMAKAELLYGKNPVLLRLAQEIIVSQGSEIAVMRAVLDKGVTVRATAPARPAKPTPPAKP